LTDLFLKLYRVREVRNFDANFRSTSPLCRRRFEMSNLLQKVATHCNLKAVRHRTSRSGLLWPILCCACAETAISELPVNIVTSPLDLAALLFLKGALMWRLDDVFMCVLYVQIEDVPYFYFRSI